MKTKIDFLEKFKQEEIKKILDIILKIGKDYIKPEIIIVFGDYVKGNYIENNLVREGDQIVEYKTVIKIFIVTRKPAQEKNMRLSREIVSKIKNDDNIFNPVNIIIEDIFSFNQGIYEKRYFYLDVINTGIILHDTKKYRLKTSEKISKSEIKNIQKQDFENCFNIAIEFLKDYRNSYNRKSYKISIFYLHQSTELFMTCYLLVKNGYKPKTHDLEILYSKLKENNKKFNNWFDLKSENYYFEILRSAYIDSRYKNNYKVKKKDLDFLLIKILELLKLVEKLCKEEI